MTNRTDTERLDWLERRSEYSLQYSLKFGWTITAWLDEIAGQGETVRAAIDAAMDAEGAS